MDKDFPLPLEELFPFLLEIDDQMRILRSGVLMQKACPGLAIGGLLADVFKPVGRSNELKSFEEELQSGRHRRPTVMQQLQSPGLVFRGEWNLCAGSRRLVFLGWPWVTDPDELSALGIPLHAIPAHNPLGDLLLLLRTNRNTLADTHALTEALHQRTLALEASNHRMQDEAALIRARDEAERANRAKSSFLANMSHELRTPLSGIIGITSLLLKRTDDPKTRDHLDKVLGSSNHLLALINDILDISKIEANRLILESIPFTLAEVVDNAQNALATRSSANHELDLRIAIPEALRQRTLNGDPLRLGQVLINLLGNAIKFTAHGHVILRAAIEEEGTGSLLLRFEIEDTGIGIRPEDRERLFLAFEQADSSTTRNHGGTGLGLAICKHLVEMMGGAIGVNSQVGFGSTFWFTVRMGCSPASTLSRLADGSPVDGAAAAEETIRNRYAGTRILIVEDEPVSKEIARELLEQIGLAVDLANDGREALDMARRHCYALILMDMQMPYMSGIEATRHIRGQSLNTATPIIATTANAFEEDRHDCLEAGMDSHLAKPISPGKLYATVLHWLENGETGRRGAPARHFPG